MGKPDLLKSNISKSEQRSIFDHIWYPLEKDVLAFKVFLYISIPLSMLLPLILNIFFKNSAWSLVGLGWLLLAILLRIVVALRFSTSNKKK